MSIGSDRRNDLEKSPPLEEARGTIMAYVLQQRLVGLPGKPSRLMHWVGGEDGVATMGLVYCCKEG